jgi:hypothetical protein
MDLIVSPREISSACRILFGRDIAVTPEFIANLHASDLRTRFRERALELHPDRATLLGRDASEMGERFKDVKLAYERLQEVVLRDAPPFYYANPATGKSSGHGGFSAPNVGSHENSGTETSNFSDQDRRDRADHYWEADIPDFKLLFGQFLYYAGLVSWRTLIDAIVWQRNQRPSFGRIARMWEYLDQKEISSILADRRTGELFGDAALSQGYLSEFQRKTVIGLQRWLQRPIGEYFMEVGLLEEDEMNYLLRLVKKHNSRVFFRSG